MTIQFNTYLKDEDWMPAMGGWRCDALLIPSTKLEALFFDGQKSDTRKYSVENHIICWSETTRPKDLLVTISLTGDLPKLEEEKLRLQREKLNLEHKKAYFENRWKVIAAIGAILSSLLTFGATYLTRSPEPAPARSKSYRPFIQTSAKALSIPEGECFDFLEANLRKSGFTDLKRLQEGSLVYAERDSYNVSVLCRGDIQAIFLAVSGRENLKTKGIREEVSIYLP